MYNSTVVWFLRFQNNNQSLAAYKQQKQQGYETEYEDDSASGAALWLNMPIF